MYYWHQKLVWTCESSLTLRKASWLLIARFLSPKVKFEWDEIYAFEESKHLNIEAIKESLKIYDITKKTCLTTDFSNTGIGFSINSKALSLLGKARGMLQRWLANYTGWLSFSWSCRVWLCRSGRGGCNSRSVPRTDKVFHNGLQRLPGKYRPLTIGEDTRWQTAGPNWKS